MYFFLKKIYFYFCANIIYLFTNCIFAFILQLSFRLEWYRLDNQNKYFQYYSQIVHKFDRIRRRKLVKQKYSLIYIFQIRHVGTCDFLTDFWDLVLYKKGQFYFSYKCMSVHPMGRKLKPIQEWNNWTCFSDWHWSK